MTTQCPLILPFGHTRVRRRTASGSDGAAFTDEGEGGVDDAVLRATLTEGGMEELYELLKDPENPYQPEPVAELDGLASSVKKAGGAEQDEAAGALQPYTDDLDYLEDHFAVIVARLKMYMADMDAMSSMTMRFDSKVTCSPATANGNDACGSFSQRELLHSRHVFDAWPCLYKT